MAALQTLVIGGGAAGLAAAIAAAERGQSVVLLEGGPRPGRKILISGNGRCNLTNVDADSVARYQGGRPGFVRPALASFPVEQTLRFFADLGVEIREEKRGRLFPVSDQAQSILDVLADRLQMLGVPVECGSRVAHLERTGKGFHAAAEDGRAWRAERVVLATGGVSLPKLGADRSGMDLAIRLGHEATSLHPGLVPLVSRDPHVRRMQGVKVRARVSVQLGKRELSDTDDLLFTAYGVSGFAVLNLSGALVPELSRHPLELHVSLFPERSPEALSEMLKARWARNPHRSLAASFAGLLSSKLAVPFLERFGLPVAERVDRVTRAQRWQLARALTDWTIEVVEPRSFEHAEVTIGGIRTDEVAPETLESYVVPGLYLAGEILDVHGELGGYNLQWAWSSGRLCGERRGG